MGQLPHTTFVFREAFPDSLSLTTPSLVLMLCPESTRLLLLIHELLHYALQMRLLLVSFEPTPSPHIVGPSIRILGSARRCLLEGAPGRDCAWQGSLVSGQYLLHGYIPGCCPELP